MNPSKKSKILNIYTVVTTMQSQRGISFINVGTDIENTTV